MAYAISWVGCSSFPKRQGLFSNRQAVENSKQGLFDPDFSPDGEKFRAGTFKWPLKRIEITSPFGKRGRVSHDGVDLRAPRGTKVFASKPGTVLYSQSRVRGYGKLVILRHDDGFFTLYGHNSKLLVRSGDRVRAGQPIALSGSTGRSTGPHLHFEIRRGTLALNPVSYLPLREGYKISLQAH